MWTSSRIAFLSLVSNVGYQMKAIALKLVVKSVTSLHSYEVFTFCSILFADFCLNRLSSGGKNSKAG